MRWAWELDFFVRRAWCWVRHPFNPIKRFPRVTILTDMQGYPYLVSCKSCGAIIQVDRYTRQLIL